MLHSPHSLPLIKIPRLLILDNFVVPRPTIRNLPSAHLFGTEEYVFWNRVVLYNYQVHEGETKFLVLYAGVAVCDRLLVVYVPLLVVCSHLLVVCGRLLVVACFSNYAFRLIPFVLLLPFLASNFLQSFTITLKIIES